MCGMHTMRESSITDNDHGEQSSNTYQTPPSHSFNSQAPTFLLVDPEALARTAQSSKSTGKKRFAPKTRSGCMTCRFRHVKCDERKPRCCRCIKADYACNYAPDKTRYFEPRQHDSTSKTGSRGCSAEGHDNGARILQAVSPIYGTPEETYYLNRFLTISAPWFSRYMEPSFFFKLLPQRSWSHPALKHSLVALALASEGVWHPSSLRQDPISKPLHQTRRDYHYAQALRLIYSSPDLNEDIVLLTSAMLWLHDNVVRNSRTAIVHLQGFLKILTERRTRMGKANWQEEGWESMLLQGLVFSTETGEEALDKTAPPDLMCNIRRRLGDLSYVKSFKSISCVREELRIGLTAIPYSVNKVQADPTGSPNRDAPVTVAELRRYFEKWYCAFSSIPNIDQANRILLKCHYICVLLSLRVGEGGPKTHSINDSQSAESIDTVLNLLEKLDLKSITQAPLGKDVELALIPVLTQVLVLTQDKGQKRRAFKILRSLHRMEGLWSSDVVADMMAVAYPPRDERQPQPRRNAIHAAPQTIREQAAGGQDMVEDMFGSSSGCAGPRVESDSSTSQPMAGLNVSGLQQVATSHQPPGRLSWDQLTDAPMDSEDSSSLSTTSQASLIDSGTNPGGDKSRIRLMASVATSATAVKFGHSKSSRHINATIGSYRVGGGLANGSYAVDERLAVGNIAEKLKKLDLWASENNTAQDYFSQSIQTSGLSKVRT